MLIGNWCQEQNGTFTLQKDSNIDTTYQNDYQKPVMPVQDNTFVWKIKENALVRAILW